jgi:hypothetical protein
MVSQHRLRSPGLRQKSVRASAVNVLGLFRVPVAFHNEICIHMEMAQLMIYLAIG